MIQDADIFGYQQKHLRINLKHSTSPASLWCNHSKYYLIDFVMPTCAESMVEVKRP